jgi:hypothetical protein
MPVSIPSYLPADRPPVFLLPPRPPGRCDLRFAVQASQYHFTSCAGGSCSFVQAKWN